MRNRTDDLELHFSALLHLKCVLVIPLCLQPLQRLISWFCHLGANVHATTATGDTALTYACENGHTDVADVLLQAGANLVRHTLKDFLSPTIGPLFYIGLDNTRTRTDA